MKDFVLLQAKVKSIFKKGNSGGGLGNHIPEPTWRGQFGSE